LHNKDNNHKDLFLHYLTLHTYLQLNQKNTLILTGGSTHVCVASTVYSAFERGYKIIIPVDGVASEDMNKHWVYLHNFMIFNSDLCTTTNLIEAIKNFIKNE